jgi:hypothetical protein
MSPKPSRMVALVASLALAACSSIGTINGQRIDGSATYSDQDTTQHYWHPCEDFEWLCVVGVAGIVTLAVLLTTQRSVGNNSGAAVATPTPPPTPSPTPSP